MKKVLIAGATGYLGKYVVRELKRKGYWVRALTRDLKKLNRLSEFIDEEFVGEVTNPDSLKGVCDNVDVVFSSIGITKQKDNLTFMDVDFQGNKNLLDEALKAGVKKFIFISVFGAHQMSSLKVIQAKLKFESTLKSSGIEYTIIYPNGFFSDMLEYLAMAKRGKVYLFGKGDNKINPIHGEDLAEICASTIDGNVKEINVGGPDILTHREIAEQSFVSINQVTKITHIPIWINNAVLKLIRVFTSERTYGGLEFFMTVLTKDLIAPTYGKNHLFDFIKENVKEKRYE